MLEWSLIENIQRENLNAIEIAISYNRLIEECSLTQDELSQRVGKNRTTVTNYLRLLRLPAEIQAAIRDGSLSMGHARALINVEDKAKQLIIASKIVANELSVREAEKLVRQLDKVSAPAGKPGKIILPLKYELLKDTLQVHLDRKIELNRTPKGKGSIVIPFASDDDLNAIISRLGIE